MKKKNSNSINDGKVAKDGKLTKKEKKTPSLLSTILKKYPWPVQKDRKCNAGGKVNANITKHDADRDSIGECSEGGFYFEKGFEILSDILSIYNDYILDDDSFNYMSHLTELNLEKDEDWSSFLEKLGICVTINELDDEDPNYIDDGYYVLTVDSKLQADLLKKLKVIKKRLDALAEADSIGKFETQNHCEIIADLVDVYGTNISASNLMSLINYDTPPIGHLTTMLLINWLKKRDDLTKPNGFGPLNDDIFLNWLAKGRQKEIMKSLEENITKDTAAAEVYEYLKKLSSLYVNEEMPRFGGQFNSVAINRYKSNKELYSGFYVTDSEKSKKKAIGAKVSHGKKQTV